MEVRPNEIAGALHPLHQIFLPQMGLPIGEIFDLEELADDFVGTLGSETVDGETSYYYNGNLGDGSQINVTYHPPRARHKQRILSACPVLTIFTGASSPRVGAQHAAPLQFPALSVN